jgi:hypothetical protein
MFHLISAEPTTVSSSENSKETVSPSSSLVWINPLVGPAGLDALEAVVDGVTSLPFVPVDESPSASKL